MKERIIDYNNLVVVAVSDLGDLLLVERNDAKNIDIDTKAIVILKNKEITPVLIVGVFDKYYSFELLDSYRELTEEEKSILTTMAFPKSVHSSTGETR